MTALGRPHLISQVLPSPFSICERGAKPWPDEGTAITVALATFNCFASVKMALFLFFFVPHLSRSLALIHSIPFLPITANPPATTTIMRLHLQHGPLGRRIRAAPTFRFFAVTFQEDIGLEVYCTLSSKKIFLFYLNLICFIVFCFI